MSVELTGQERRVLCAGLAVWGGSAKPTDALAVALGFLDVPDLMAESRRLYAALDDGERLSSRDVVRALAVTEVAFASDIFGAGVEWPTVSGMSDEETVATLRLIQRKLVGGYGALWP